MAERNQFDKRLEARTQELLETIAQLEARISRSEQLQDKQERAWMTDAIIGDAVSSHPQMRLFADYLVTSDDKYFQRVHDLVTYPEVREPCEKCEIFIFELTATGIEGDPFDFKILVCDGRIVDVRRGESLNS